MKRTDYPLRTFWADASDEIDVRNTLYAMKLDGQAYSYLYAGPSLNLVKYRLCMPDEDYVVLKLKFKLTDSTS
jgi:hypothetical protein